MSVNLTAFVVLEEDQKMAKRYSFKKVCLCVINVLVSEMKHFVWSW